MMRSASLQQAVCKGLNFGTTMQSTSVKGDRYTTQAWHLYTNLHYYGANKSNVDAYDLWCSVTKQAKRAEDIDSFLSAMYGQTGIKNLVLKELVSVKN